MRLLYTLVIFSLTPLVLFRLYFLGKKNKAYRQRWSERFGFVSWPKEAKPIIWVHAVSVGEVNAATPLVQQFLEKYTEHQLLITTVTPTGATTVNKRFGKDVMHLYLPYDLPFSVKRFLRIVKPEILVTMETEIWPNLYSACNQLDIPIFIINARLSQRAVKRYRLVSKLMTYTLSLVEIIAAQTHADAERFISFGANKEKVFVTGNIKFDISVPHSITEQAQSLKRYFSINRPIWIAASTHEGEEEIILDAHMKILEKYSDAVLILAPRHPDRADKVASYCKNRNLLYINRTNQTMFKPEHTVYILDTLGELQLHYAASQVAFVGGSLVASGGQNMMEPASLGLPVISGPHTFNFTEITDLLIKNNALIQVSDDKELTEQICKLFSDANLRFHIGELSKEVIELNKGNIEKLIELFDQYIPKRNATFVKNHNL